MGLAIKCVYCEKPLVDADHARNHVVNQCEKSPSKRLADALQRLLAACRNDNGIEGLAAEEQATAALREAGRIQ